MPLPAVADARKPAHMLGRCSSERRTADANRALAGDRLPASSQAGCRERVARCRRQMQPHAADEQPRARRSRSEYSEAQAGNKCMTIALPIAERQLSARIARGNACFFVDLEPRVVTVARLYAAFLSSRMERFRGGSGLRLGARSDHSRSGKRCHDTSAAADSSTVFGRVGVASQSNFTCGGDCAHRAGAAVHCSRCAGRRRADSRSRGSARGEFGRNDPH